ncbi:MAG: nickel-responsive transcriptional regulator NikR [Candidatus Margulisiibacteriota bacterium]|nr:nickel-responsive transcriptional regulator NikR [Candidatus Margulisiibacteriota bacterium]
MSNIERFGISAPEDLLEKFDKISLQRGYTSRSEAIRDLMRDNIVEQSIAEDKEVVGTVTIVYNHHTRALADKLTDMQHDFYKNIISSTHIHMDHHNCLEILVVKGKAQNVKDIGNRLISTKGVKHGKLVVTATGKEIV